MRRWFPIVTAALAALVAAAPAAAADPSGAARTGATAGKAAKAKPVNCAKVKCIALTFDDGPGRYTGKLLETLRENKTTVTFFLMGEHVDKYRGTARAIARAGHEIGNHTYAHPHLTSLYDGLIRDELVRAQDSIERATGKRPTLMRPPYGDTDDRVSGIAAELGLAQILWNRTSRDWELRDSKAITKRVLKDAARNRIVLMHDIWPETVAAMPGILRSLKKKGFHVVTVGTLLRGRELAPGEMYPLTGWR
ncbi:polysaccharide deacetylase family protein [Sphaerisporangium sp. B11E5]|uniref:polysaccharide deacetylase family protein n=1 Tax=Sphaerisporangium sp. B11E5 TaxID=3153563 RepID=UPI00325EEFF0